MRVYSEYEIISYDEIQGLVQIKWMVKEHPDQFIIRQHLIPIEAELGKWSKEDYLKHFRNSVTDAADIPNWIKNEKV